KRYAWVMIPPVRVAIASPVAKPAKIVADHVGTTRRAIRTMASIAKLIAARNGTSIGAKNNAPYKEPVIKHSISAGGPAQHPTKKRANGSNVPRPGKPARNTTPRQT